MLQDRVETAVLLYQAGKVNKLLLSGDNRYADYNEPARMMDYALSRGVPAEDIQLDYAGRRTYDTCYRAGAIFQLDYNPITLDHPFTILRYFSIHICLTLSISL